jgi:hypothetical protein
MSLLNGGVQLSLYVGPVPIAAPRELIEALVRVKVEHHSGGIQSGFELTFELPARSPLCTLFLVTGGGGVPLIRVVLAVTINGRSESIIDGVMTHVQMQPGQGGVSRVIVMGKDMSALMAKIELPGIPYPAMPPSARVLLCLAKYAVFGVIPMVIPSILDIPPLPMQQIPQQRGSDYAYVKDLAQKAGYVFYLEPGPTPGTSKAYWGPEIRIGEPQPALTTNTGSLDNVEKLSFKFNKEKKKMPIVFFQESMSKAPIPVLIPDISPLNPPLGIVPPLPPDIEKLEDTGHLSAPEALMAGLAYASQNSDCVFGDGSLDVAKYGRLLKSRQLVGVRGAGLPFDGLFYVDSVTHEIERGSYKQNFTLARNALISTVPRVPV